VRKAEIRLLASAAIWSLSAPCWMTQVTIRNAVLAYSSPSSKMAARK
jgi:hypothetical protein